LSFFDIIGRLVGLVPDAVKAGQQIAEAVKPKPKIDVSDASLWHTLQYDNHIKIRGNLSDYTLTWCSVCQAFVLQAKELCPEAVRRREAGTG
jgi:hypothetical protein